MSAQSVVVDLGANRGEFSHELSKRFGCRCYAVEPLPALCSMICESDLVHVSNYAISRADGPVTLHVSKFPESHSLFTRTEGSCVSNLCIEGVTFETFLKGIGVAAPDLLKIDIEGSEIDLFDSTSDDTFRRTRQISVEFHDFIDAVAFERPIKLIKERLRTLGLFSVVFSRRDNSDVLFVNRALCNMSWGEFLYLRYLSRYFAGGMRLLHRTRRRIKSHWVERAS